MKLKALNQIHVSAVKADSLRPGEEFDVSEALGKELLAKHPSTFAAVYGEKAEAAPKNKAEPAAPSNKSKKKAD